MADDSVRVAEVLGVLSLATDLGMGMPLEHGLRSTVYAVRLAVPDGLREMLVAIYERWDGKGFPGRLSGEAIPLPVRIVQVARDADIQIQAGGLEHAVTMIKARAGHAFDPAVVNAFVARA